MVDKLMNREPRKKLVFYAGSRGDPSVGVFGWDAKVTIEWDMSVDENNVTELKEGVKDMFEGWVCDGAITEYEWLAENLADDEMYVCHLETDNPKGWKTSLKTAKQDLKKKQKQIANLKKE